MEILKVCVSNMGMIGVPITNVMEILPEMKITKIPMAPKDFSGIGDYRGRAVSIYDLSSVLGQPNELGTQIFVILKHNDVIMSLCVPMVDEVIDLTESEIVRMPMASKISPISHAWKKQSGKEIIPLLNIERLFSLFNLKK